MANFVSKQKLINVVLHITNDFSGSEVYKNLIQELDRLGIKQIVYTPVKTASSIGKNKLEFRTSGSTVIYSHILNKSFDRLLYRRKIKKIFNDIESKIGVGEIDMIHAHTWYSDGGVAYKLHLKYGIPYVVTVRNTDLNIFQKYLFYERSYGRTVLANTKNVVLISASYKERLLAESSLQKIKNGLRDKLKVIPNGVDRYWITNANRKKKEINKNKFSILFIGKFTEGKNVLQLQAAVNEINKDKVVAHLHLIGGGGGAHHKVTTRVRQNPTTMSFHGKILDLGMLKEYFELADIFAMPSKHETFGLVYVEALLQGLPILYTQHEGIDGFYEEKIGEKVVIGDVAEIKEKLLKLVEDYHSYSIPTEKIIAHHDWRNIALEYQHLYK